MQAKMEENKLEAKMKLTTKNTHGVVVNMGPTWFKALEPEFTKPYFLKVCPQICISSRICFGIPYLFLFKSRKICY